MNLLFSLDKLLIDSKMEAFVSSRRAVLSKLVELLERSRGRCFGPHLSCLMILLDPAIRTIGCRIGLLRSLLNLLMVFCRPRDRIDLGIHDGIVEVLQRSNIRSARELMSEKRLISFSVDQHEHGHVRVSISVFLPVF